MKGKSNKKPVHVYFARHSPGEMHPLNPEKKSRTVLYEFSPGKSKEDYLSPMKNPSPTIHAVSKRNYIRTAIRQGKTALAAETFANVRQQQNF